MNKKQIGKARPNSIRQTGKDGYRWRDKHPYCDLIRTWVQADGRLPKEIALKAHIAPQTLYNLLDGKTIRPQVTTFTLLAHAMGKEIRAHDVGTVNSGVVVPPPEYFLPAVKKALSKQRGTK